MPGLPLTTLIALLSGCDAFRLGLSQRIIPLSPPGGALSQDESPVLPRFIQELVRIKRHSVQELVRAQPNLVHDMGWPKIQEISRSLGQMDAANSSQITPQSSASPGQSEARPPAAVDEEDEMEHMVHLASTMDAEHYRGQPDVNHPETELLGGPGAGETSQEASGFYRTDMEDRDRGEEGAEDRERRGGEDEWERDTGEDREWRGARGRGEEEQVDGGIAAEIDHLTPDLDTLIGYSPSLHPSSSVQPILSSPAELHDSGKQEHRATAVLEIGPSEKELLEVEGEEDVQSSGYEVLHSSVTTSSTTSAATSTSPPTVAAAAAGGDDVGTATPETDTGTDFGLLGSFTKEETEEEETEREEEHDGVFRQNPTVPEVGIAPSREPLQPSVEEEDTLEQEEHEMKIDVEEEEKWKTTESEGTRTRHIIPLTTDPSPTINFTDLSWDWLEKTTPVQSQRSEVRGTEEMKEAQQVVCIDWKELVGRGYVILNMTQNLNCEEFRADQGVRLLKIMERVFARRMNSPEGSWVLYLSKPTHQQHQLLMNVASERGVIATSDVLDMLGEIRKNLNKVGIQNYSSTSRCQSQPSQTRSDYGKLFVVLVIIGSFCMAIITSGFIYICWQRRLPATKTTFRAEELHFVENGCHDNPMLDVTNDSQPEMQEKKPSTNGLTGAGDRSGEDSSRWQVFVNQAATEEEEEEQDTHL
ncbi:hypothetical protein JOB18_019511 [Solea senegalensis]|nr:podocalyxin-like protein 2 [Solea senegalensis]KAG7493949.1 hypothetical protein JOB18_019511 [Solea senegalensis]